MSNRLEIFTDGACSGNPGPAGIGVVLKREGKIVKEISRGLGLSTNNCAEYTAVLDGLQEALSQDAPEVILFTDSELIYHQLTGQYKIKNERIKPIFEQIKHLVRGFKRVEIQHIPRTQNNEADLLAKKAIRREQAKVVAPPRVIRGEESPSSIG